jgi:hypothetical protein
MKRVSALLACLLTFAVVLPAQAGGHHGHGGYHGGYGNHWLAPVLGAAVVGSVIYAASTPSYAMTQPVVVQQQYAPPSRVAYFCPTAQQYYPTVPTCQVPWQPVNY